MKLINKKPTKDILISLGYIVLKEDDDYINYCLTLNTEYCVLYKKNYDEYVTDFLNWNYQKKIKTVSWLQKIYNLLTEKNLYPNTDEVMFYYKLKNKPTS